MTWKTLKDGLVLLVNSELFIFGSQIYLSILAALARWTEVGRERVWLTLPLSGRQGLGNAGWESMVACPLEGRVIRSSMP